MERGALWEAKPEGLAYIIQLFGPNLASCLDSDARAIAVGLLLGQGEAGLEWAGRGSVKPRFIPDLENGFLCLGLTASSSS